MSVNGSFGTNYYDGKRLVLYWERVRTNVDTPSTTIKYRVYCDSGSGYDYTGPVYVDKADNGYNWYNIWAGWGDHDLQLWNGTEAVGWTETTINHNASTGAGWFALRVNAAIYSFSQNVTGSGAWDLDKVYKRAVTGAVTGNVIGDSFKVAYTSYGGYTYKLRISVPGVKAYARIDYNTSNASFNLSQSVIDALVADYPNNSSFSLGFAVESYSGSTLVSSGNETTITATIKKPTVSGLSSSNVTRTGATVLFNYSSVVGISERRVQISTNKSTFVVNTTVNANSYTTTALQANTKYYYRVSVTNKGGTTWSDWGEFTTTGNAPSLVNPYTTLTIGNAYVNCGQISFDTNASLSTRTLEYKKSSESNYSTSGDGYNFTTVNNTNYDYKLTITDNFNRSSNVTGTFKSAGNMPTVSFDPTEITPTKAVLGITYTFDNTSFGSGTYTLKKDSTVITTGNLPAPVSGVVDPITLNNLKPNATYELSGTLTDSASNTTNYTYTFKTKPGIKINTMVAVEFKVDGQIVKGLRLNGIDLF